MPQIPAKFVDKEKVGIKEKETFVMEVEAECDRQNLCQKIITLVDQQVQNSNQSALSQTEQPTAQEQPKAATKKEKAEESKRKGLKNSGDDTNTASSTQMKVNGVSINLDNI